MRVTTVRLQPEVEATLREMAESSGRSRSWLINEAVRRMSEEDQLERQRWLETLEALESVAQDGVVPSEEVHAWLRTWGASDEDVADDAES